MSNQVTGRAYIRFDGVLLASREGAKLNWGGVKREPVVGNDVHGFAESVDTPELECNISHKSDTSLQTLANITDATITFECDTGPVYTLRHAWIAEPPKLTAKDGEVSLKFNAQTCEEQA
jgi:hypothetical protein